MPIKVNALDGKVTRLTYSTQTINLEIEVYVFWVRNVLDENNIGTILEKFRELVRDGRISEANAIVSEKESQLNRFINLASYPFMDFIFEQLFVFYPADKIRNDFLKSFVKKMTSHCENISEIDKSGYFTKVNPNSTVVAGLSVDDFNFDLTLDNPIKKLLLIDDTINQGRTVEILLNKLNERELITSQSEVKLICIYNIEKSTEVDWRSIMKSKGH